MRMIYISVIYKLTLNLLPPKNHPFEYNKILWLIVYDSTLQKLKNMRKITAGKLINLIERPRRRIFSNKLRPLIKMAQRSRKSLLYQRNYCSFVDNLWN